MAVRDTVDRIMASDSTTYDSRLAVSAEISHAYIDGEKPQQDAIATAES